MNLYSISNMDDDQQKNFFKSKPFVELARYYTDLVKKKEQLGVDDIYRHQVNLFEMSLKNLYPSLARKLARQKVQRQDNFLSKLDYDPLQELYDAGNELKVTQRQEKKSIKDMLDKIETFQDKLLSEHELMWGYTPGPKGEKNYKKAAPLNVSELDVARILATDPEYISLTSEINKYNPDKVYQKAMDVKGIHQRDGGPCADTLDDMEWNPYSENYYRCSWAQACVAARVITNEEYQRVIPILMDLLDKLDDVVNRIVEDLSPGEREAVYELYEKRVNKPTHIWIDKMYKSVSGHVKAEEKTRQFRDWCQRKYRRQAHNNRTNKFEEAIEDLNSFSRKDLQLMARHFGIDQKLEDMDLKAQLAVTFFKNL